jgi:hypothetical protein
MMTHRTTKEGASGLMVFHKLISFFLTHPAINIVSDRLPVIKTVCSDDFSSQRSGLKALLQTV